MSTTLSYKELQKKLADATNSKRKLMDIARSLPSMSFNHILEAEELIKNEIKRRCEKDDYIGERYFGER